MACNPGTATNARTIAKDVTTTTSQGPAAGAALARRALYHETSNHTFPLLFFFGSSTDALELFEPFGGCHPLSLMADRAAQN